LKNAVMVRVEKLGEGPYASVICYPKPTRAELRKRLRELQKLDVKAVEFGGEKQFSSLSVLGKGCVGIVTKAYRNSEKIALKIRRVDADRTRMQVEARMLEKANAAKVGPRLLGVSKNFLLMQFVDGVLLPSWLDKRVGKALVRRVLRDVLEQCWRLDTVGLDHGELSHALKHIIIDKNDKPFIVDFETASLTRRPSNVTSVCQFIFLSSTVAEKVSKKLDEIDKEAIVGALRRYKNERTRGNFDFVMGVCGLQTM